MQASKKATLRAFLFTALASVCAIYTASGAEQAAAAAPPKPELSQVASETLGKVKPLADAGNYDGALIAIRDLVKASAPGSYDLAMANFYLAMVHLNRNDKDKGDYAGAIPALEYVVGTTYQLPAKQIELKYVLAQLCVQENQYLKAEKYVKEWLAGTDRPTPEGVVFFTSLLIQRAQKDDNTVDKTLLEEALVEINKGLRMGVKPHDTLFYLKVAALQGLGKWADAAELLELMVKKSPQTKNFWSQLFVSYITTNDDMRAVLTIERAQAHGAMDTPADNMRLVHLYHNMKQYEKTIELLEKGLGDGSISPEKQNWDLLAYAYQQMHREFKAIETFNRAKEHVENGHYEVQMGNAYFGLRQFAKAVEFLEAGLKRGIDNPAPVMLFAAYVAYEELRDLDRAKALLERAQPVLQDDRQKADFKGLNQVVSDAIKAREEEKKEKEKETPAARI